MSFRFLTFSLTDDSPRLNKDLHLHLHLQFYVCLPSFKSITEIINILLKFIWFGDAVSTLKTFVLILNHVSRSITWSLITLKASNLVKSLLSPLVYRWDKI